ncbi:MAG: TetR/AcrR family transcriptional regulator [Candidatus Cloacimonetes bacterium]|nr:TetR/AcrR family transcriptional regulator [Candidatus Cloacimonadota bacterium]
MVYATANMNRRKQKRKSNILAAALKVFASKGFHDTKIKDIAKKAKVGTGTIYLYYENKESLLINCFEEMISDLLGKAQVKIAGTTDELKRIMKFIENHIDYCMQNPNAAKLLIVELKQSTEIYKRHPDYWPLKSYMDYLIKLCGDAVEVGKIRRIDPGLLATIIYGCMDFSITNWLISKTNIDLHEVKTGIAEIIYNGLLNSNEHVKIS